ncbi:MAG: domain containing protein [Verrucomicrobia bacterium]|nr:domain containing protein [Verrucomicrobiota bacterium]
MVYGAAGATNEAGVPIVVMLTAGVEFIISIAYTIFFIGAYGATPGKMACKIRVVNPDGSKVSYAKATGRAFAEMLSGCFCAVGYIMAAFDAEKRSLHDRICATRVIRN